MKQALSAGWSLFALSLTLVILLFMVGFMALFPQYVTGPFMTVHSQSATVRASDGEILIATDRTINHAARSGTYHVRIDRVLPKPPTLICHGGTQVPYTNLGKKMLILDLGYYTDDKKGGGRELCPEAYDSEMIQVRTLWCQYRIFGWCAGPVEPETPLVIDLRKG